MLSEDTSGAVIGALGFTTGRNTEKLKNIRYKMLQEGLPVLKENICCWMLCKVIQTVETPTHTVFFAAIEAGSERSAGKPMTYEYYHKVGSCARRLMEEGHEVLVEQYCEGIDVTEIGRAHV